MHGVKQGADNADQPTTSVWMPQHTCEFDDTRTQREHLELMPMSRTQHERFEPNANVLNLTPTCQRLANLNAGLLVFIVPISDVNVLVFVNL